MNAFGKTAAAAALLALLALQGCVCMTPSEDLKLHGKCGKGFQYFGAVIGVGLDVVFLPATVFFNGKEDPIYGDFGYVVYPGYGSEAAFYHLGAGLAYPVYLCALPFESSIPKSKDKEVRLRSLVEALPHLDDAGYLELLILSKRECAPAYLPAPHAYRFGWRDTLDRELSGEWRHWLASGFPSGGKAERKAIVRYWLFKAGDDAMERGRWAFACDLLCKAASVSEDDVYKFWRDSGNAGRYGPSIAAWRYWVQMHGGLEAIFADGPGSSTR